MDYCYHVKGLCRGPHPAGLFALAHATSTRGADHLRGRSWAYGENDSDLFPLLVKTGIVPPQKPFVRETLQGEEELEKHEEMLTEYYRVHGYEPETGIPTRGWLECIGLKYVADELEAHGPYPKWDGPPLWHLDRYPHGGTRA